MIAISVFAVCTVVASATYAGLRHQMLWNSARILDRPQAAPYGRDMTKAKRQHDVYTLLVEIGRKAGDGLPDGATGAALMVYASGVDEAEAVRETVAILKQADTAPLDVSGYGTLSEREAEGHDISDEERVLMQRALDENAVIVAQVTPFFDD